MRPDYKDIAVNTARSGRNKKGYGGAYKRHRNKSGIRDQGMRAPYHSWADRKEFTDRLEPIFRMLNKNIGRPWNKIWSEICANADSREIRGYHIRTHILQTVKLQGKEEPGYWLNTRYGYVGYYVDDNGLLKRTKNSTIYGFYHRKKKVRIKLTTTQHKQRKSKLNKESKIRKDWQSYKAHLRLLRSKADPDNLYPKATDEEFVTWYNNFRDKIDFKSWCDTKQAPVV